LAPEVSVAPAAPGQDSGVYTVSVEGHSYVVEVSEGGDVQHIAATPPATDRGPASQAAAEAVPAPLAGNIVKLEVGAGDQVASGDVIVVLEAMKMETEVRAPRAGQVAGIEVKAGDSVAVGDTLLTLS
jgi:oxaloacetate decarboxylase alpha subunit